MNSYEDNLEEHRKLVLEKQFRLKEVGEKHFPGKFSVLMTCLAVKAITLIDGVGLPFMLVLLGPPSSGKSTIIAMIASLPDALSVDSFTPKALVSHYASKLKEDLEKDDLLKQIADKIFLTPDLAPLFSSRDDKLIEIIGMLTRILDGQGYKSSSGVHGQRGYDKIFFVWIGAMVDVPKNIWPLIARLGAKQFFLRLDRDISYEEEQKKILQNMSGMTYDQKIKEVNDDLKEYWDAVRSFPLQKDGKIIWDTARDDQSAVLKIVEHSQLLARLRAHTPTDKTEKTSGSNYGFLTPIIEDPERATFSLYNLARGHAIDHGRNYITHEDLSVVEPVVLSSAPKERVELLKLLIENNGEVNSTQFMIYKNVTRTTALRTMKQLEILGLVDMTEYSTKTKPRSAIRLKEPFRWLLKDNQKN